MKHNQRIKPAESAGKTGQLYHAAQAALGVVPNAFKVLGNSPAALAGYMEFGAALQTGVLSAQVREQIALTVAEANLCDYCLSAHTFMGEKCGVSEQELAAARNANSKSPKTDAILKLARAIVLERGEISDAEMGKAISAGITEAEIVETVANVAINIFTNYINHVARTAIDFPEVKAGCGAEGCGCQH